MQVPKERDFMEGLSDAGCKWAKGDKLAPEFGTLTHPKTNMDAQHDGLEKVTPFKHGNFLISMLDFWGV